MFESAPFQGRRCRVLILISGRGSNMIAILEAQAAGHLPVDIVSVISNRPDAAGLAAAHDAGIHTTVVNHLEFGTDIDGRRRFEEALRAEIELCNPDLVVLAGFMRILGADFVRHYHGKMFNIHPSLLPAFPGLDTHARALEAGVRIHGCSVHFVTADLDRGPVVIQAAVPVHTEDDADSLATRVLQAEHLIYPQAIRYFAEGRVLLSPEGKLRLDRVQKVETALCSPALD